MSTSEFDPASVPLRSAATVLLIDDRPDLQVFMMKRNVNTAFAGGMWVFPGGSVDLGDTAENYSDYCVHRSEAQACEALGLIVAVLHFMLQQFARRSKRRAYCWLCIAVITHYYSLIRPLRFSGLRLIGMV